MVENILWKMFLLQNESDCFFVSIIHALEFVY